MKTQDHRNYHTKEFYNEILFESENFIVIPSLGSLVEGWLLIVPKKHYLSMQCVDNEILAELENLSAEVEKNLVKEYEHVVMFEHGAITNNSTVGCGVDYAHLHIVPVKYDLLKGLKDFLNINYEWKRASGLKDAIISLDNELEYLYYKDSNGNSYFVQHENFPSQLFRKVIANFENIPEKFDWKLNYGIENISKTLNRFSSKNNSLEIKEFQL